jgi:dipeptidyl aminopeptidase/acylaminoacyl peptidase
LVAVALGAVLTHPATAQQGFTLDQVMSAPFPSDLTAAAKGGRFAWVQDDRGMRNLWVAEAPGYQGRQVTQYAEDDGQELTNVQFTPDGTMLVYVRGGPPNRAGEIPNPISDPEGETQAVWVVPVAGGAPRKLGDGTAPAISPRGDVVAFLQRGEVWSVSLTDTTAKATRLFQARGNQNNLAWSPDGAMLAFVSGRGDHGFVGVYDVRAKQLRYLDPSVDRDGEPAWSPDGKRIAFIRIPGNKRALPFIEERQGEPWSIRVVDVATGQGREVWRAERGTGSVFHDVVVENQLLWAAGDRIVFPWERDGWVHLYSVPVTGGSATLLTPGRFEVEYVALAPNGREVIYNSNQDDMDRRHLWRVAATGGAPVALTKGTGIEWSPAVADDGTLAFLASDARTPAHAEVLAGGTRRMLAASSLPADFPSRQLVEPQQVIFSAADGMRIHGQLFLPRDLKPGERRPALLFFHGGSRRQMLLGWHYMYYYHNAYAQNQYLASKGYLVLSVNYRSGIGYGMEFREALNYGAHGASEYNDVVGAGLYLRSRPDVDPDRIGLWGGSYGGYLTALGLARSSDLFKAGVDFHGVHDWNVVIRNFAPGYDAQAREDVARLAFQSSPMASISTWRSPVLLIHGDDDRNVPFSETVDVVEALRGQGVTFEELIFPDEVHDFLLHRDWVRAYAASADFLDRKLKSGPATGAR